jgi:hypothetical protein
VAGAGFLARWAGKYIGGYVFVGFVPPALVAVRVLCVSILLACCYLAAQRSLLLVASTVSSGEQAIHTKLSRETDEDEDEDEGEDEETEFPIQPMTTNELLVRQSQDQFA